MLSKMNKVIMYAISVITIILGLVTAIPFRTLPFAANCEDILKIEFLVKLICIPVAALLLVIYPNYLKYKQIVNRQERSKVINVLSYLPILVYIVSLLILLVHTLTFKYYPMSAGAHGTLLAICVCYLTFVICAIYKINILSVSLSRKSNYLLDTVVGVSLVIFVLLSWRILDSYANSYGLIDGYIYGKVNFDPYLFVLYILLFFVTVYYCATLFNIIKADETLVFSNVLTNEQIDEIICEEYNHAYRDILKDLEAYIADEEYVPLHAEALPEEIEEEVSEEIKEEPAVVEQVEEQPQEEPAVQEEVVEEQEPETVEEELSEKKLESLEDLNELNELLVQTDSKNDEMVAEQAEQIKAKIEEEKNALAKEREELESYRAAATAAILALQAQLDEIEDSIEEVVEEKPAPKKKVFKPTFEQVVTFAKSLQDDSWKVVENLKENGTGTIKFSKGKTLFLVLQSTNSDYRVTFLATEKKWSTILTGVKGVSIPKNAKGDKWLRFVNKGIAEASVIKSFIRESVKGADEEIARIEAEKEAEKQRKAEAKNAQKAAQENK
jgi:hypothetical protein